MRKTIVDDVAKLVEPVKVLYLSTYIPRKCGLATYTKDLTNALNLLNPLSEARIAAMHKLNGNNFHYPHEVKYIINQDELKDYKKLAKKINEKYEVLCMQHEFGIYGGEDGEYVIELLRRVEKPVITTLHTVLASPSSNQKRILEYICMKSAIMIVMLEAAKNILVDTYRVDPDKIAVIHHGVPDFPRLESEYWKKKLQLSRFVTMVSANLISPAKGLEYAIESIPEIIKHIPNFRYLIVGITHPEFLKSHNGKDVYRKALKKMIKRLGIERHVRFVNKYLTLKQQIGYIGAADYYVTPYVGMQQAASGALAYAIGGGKTCISTPYIYAKEMLSNGRGVLVPNQNSKAIGKSVIELYKNNAKKEKIEQKVYEIGRTMTWFTVAHQYFHLFKYVIGNHKKH